jgi:GH24 family phage-related lysozyme (muramidase)
MMPTAQAIADGKRWEGDSLVVYPDSRGLPTQGRGRHTGVHFGDAPITRETLELWFAQDWATHYAGARSLFPGIATLGVVRQEALTWLVFNMGEATLALFVPFIEHVNAGEWDEAAYHLQTNLSGHITPYETQVGARAVETALRIATGNVLREFAVS